PMKPLYHLHIALIIAFVAVATGYADGPWLGNGIKSGEATSDSIVVWTRLTAKRDMSAEGIPWSHTPPKRDGDDYIPQIPEGHTLDEMAYALPGAPGEVR